MFNRTAAAHAAAQAAAQAAAPRVRQSRLLMYWTLSFSDASGQTVLVVKCLVIRRTRGVRHTPHACRSLPPSPSPSHFVARSLALQFHARCLGGLRHAHYSKGCSTRPRRRRRGMCNAWLVADSSWPRRGWSAHRICVTGTAAQRSVRRASRDAPSITPHTHPLLCGPPQWPHRARARRARAHKVQRTRTRAHHSAADTRSRTPTVRRQAARAPPR